MRSIFLGRYCLILGLALLGCACSNISTSSFSEMSSGYRGVVEQYTNDNILLNIVRTSQNMPMSFLDIPSIVGTGSVTGSASLGADIKSNDPVSIGGFFAPGAGTVYKPNVGMSVVNTFNFTQASLDNSQFMTAFLKQVPLETINFRGTEDNLPKEVLYSLLIDQIEIRSADNEVLGSWRNNPRSEDYGEFQTLLYLLVDLGLKSEVREESEAIGPLIGERDMLKNLAQLTNVLSAQNGSFTYIKRVKNGQNYYQLTKVKSRNHVCINKHAALQLIGNQLAESAYCLDSPIRHTEFTNDYKLILARFDRKASNLNLVIRLRSTGNVFNFLGEVLSVQLNANTPYLVSVRSAIGPDGEISKSQQGYPLLKVYKNAKPDNPIYSVAYRGDQYYVNGDNETYSSKTLEFVSTLITANKLPGAIPPAPALVIR